MLRKLEQAGGGRHGEIVHAKGKRLARTTSLFVGRVSSRSYMRDVAPVRTPRPVSGNLSEMGKLEEDMPAVFSEMLSFLQADARMRLPSLIAMCNLDHMEALADALLKVYSYDQHVHLYRLLHWAVDRHLADPSTTPTTLFRATSLEMKIISLFIHREGRGFLSYCITPFLSALQDDLPYKPQHVAERVEVDPSKLREGDDLEENQQRLKRTAGALIQYVLTNGKCIPNSISQFLRYVKRSVGAKFPALGTQAVSGILFLRMICPALVAPDQYLGQPTPTRTVRRTLVLTSKVLQNLANGVSFGDKECYLTFMNGWLEQQRDKMHRFLSDAMDTVLRVAETEADITAEQRGIAVIWLHNFFCMRRKKLRDQHLPELFCGPEGKKKAAAFYAKLRRATNNFRPISANEMPSEWRKELRGNLLQRSYSTLKGGLTTRRNKKKRSTVLKQSGASDDDGDSDGATKAMEEDDDAALDIDIDAASSTVAFANAFPASLRSSGSSKRFKSNTITGRRRPVRRSVARTQSSTGVAVLKHQQRKRQQQAESSLLDSQKAQQQMQRLTLLKQNSAAGGMSLHADEENVVNGSPLKRSRADAKTHSGAHGQGDAKENTTDRMPERPVKLAKAPSLLGRKISELNIFEADGSSGKDDHASKGKVLSPLMPRQREPVQRSRTLQQLPQSNGGQWV